MTSKAKLSARVDVLQRELDALREFAFKPRTVLPRELWRDDRPVYRVRIWDQPDTEESCHFYTSSEPSVSGSRVQAMQTMGGHTAMRVFENVWRVTVERVR